MKIAAIVLAALLTATAPALARDRQLEGVGPEGERVVLSLTQRDPECIGRGETAASATWPDGTVRWGCLLPRYSIYQPILVRWREVRDGRPVEWTVEYPQQLLTLVRVKVKP